MPNLDTLVSDVYSLFDPKRPHEVNEENLETFTEGLKKILRHRLAEREVVDHALRFSSLGRKNRQHWYDAHSDGQEEELTSKTLLKFLYGDVIEALVLFLVKEADHTVEMEQAEIEVQGVKGHIDALIDGKVVDVKSASPYGYKKFKQNDVVGNDPFGYVEQLSGYASVLTPNESAAWLAFDKVHGDLCVSPLSASVIADNDPLPRIEELKEVILLPEPPPRCYPDVEDGASGNRKLGTACSYCRHKNRCWPGLRTFLYANTPRFLTVVAKTPNVPEVVAGDLVVAEDD